VAANGSLDEANSFIGLASLEASESTGEVLGRIQNDLFDIGADLSKPERSGLKVEPLRITEAQVQWLEGKIDEYNNNLTPLRSFVLPSGSIASVYLHVAWSVVRRAAPMRDQAPAQQVERALSGLVVFSGSPTIPGSARIPSSLLLRAPVMDWAIAG
jgi:ATP:cob(I)alamin adenosyltransferase